MKDYVAENERILNEWREKYVKENQQKYPKCSNLGDYFANDGIMYKGEIRGAYKYYENEECKFSWIRLPGGRENILWANTPIRVLFLTKDQNTNDDTAWDVRNETFWAADESITPKERRIDTSRFNSNLVYILFGILNTTSDRLMGYSEFTDKEALNFVDNQIFARINCKKEVGEDKCPNNILKKAIDNDKRYLKEQILNLDADILVCCGHQNEENIILNTVYDIYKNEFEYVNFFEDKGTGIHYNAKRNILAIDAYHLSHLNGGSEARYNETVGMYYEFLKYLKKTKGIDFSNSHRLE